MHPDETANVNGIITPLDRATIPVNDHGFLYGDGIYETIRTYRWRPFSLAAHFDRLERSARSIRLPLPCGKAALREEVMRTLEAARAASPPSDVEYAIRIMVTRGPGPLGYDPALCPTPTLVVLLTRLRRVSEEERCAGVAAIVATVRRNPIEALDPRIKSSNLLNNILAAHQAKDSCAAEAILFNTAGDLAEGTLTNVFLVKDGRVSTPSLECGILSGITREILLDVMRDASIPCAQGRYREEDLRAADEIFLTSTTREILPVARLDGHAVGSGRRGPMTEMLQTLFSRRVEEILSAEPSEPGA